MNLALEMAQKLRSGALSSTEELISLVKDFIEKNGKLPTQNFIVPAEKTLYNYHRYLITPKHKYFSEDYRNWCIAEGYLRSESKQDAQVAALHKFIESQKRLPSATSTDAREKILAGAHTQRMVDNPEYRKWCADRRFVLVDATAQYIAQLKTWIEANGRLPSSNSSDLEECVLSLVYSKTTIKGSRNFNQQFYFWSLEKLKGATTQPQTGFDLQIALKESTLTSVPQVTILNKQVEKKKTESTFVITDDKATAEMKAWIKKHDRIPKIEASDETEEALAKRYRNFVAKTSGSYRKDFREWCIKQGYLRERG